MSEKVTSAKIRKSENILIWMVMSAMFIVTLAWPGFFLSDIAVKLNLTDFQTGLLNAASNIMLPFQLFASFLAVKYGRRKLSYLIYCGLLRVMVLILGCVFVVFSYHPFSQIGSVTIGILLLLHLFNSFATPVFFDWIGDVVPPRDNANFWGKRTAVLFMSSILASLLIGAALKYCPGGIMINAVFLVVAGAIGVAETLAYTMIPAMESEPKGDRPLVLKTIKSALGNFNFRNFAACNSMFNFAGMMFGAFFYIYLLKSLEWSPLRIQLFVVAAGVTSFVGSYFWAEVAALRGNKPVLIISLVIKTVEIGGYAIMAKNSSLWGVLPYFLVGGFANSGLAVSTSSMLTAEVPKESRSIFTAMFFSISGAAGALGCLTGGFMMSFFHDFHASFLGLRFEAFHTIALFNILAMPLCVFFILPYRAGKGGSALNTAAAFFEGNPALSFLRLVKLTGKSGFQDRYSFISRNRSSLFVQELISALDDPSPLIRYRAAYSLGGIKHPDSEAALLKELVNEDGGLAVGAAYSLGRLKSSKALPLLHKSILSEDRNLRAAAAWALGETRDTAHIEVLRSALARERSAFASAYMADALGRLGDLESIDMIFARLMKCQDPGIRFQFCVAIANIIAGGEEFYELIIKEQESPFSAIEALMKIIDSKIKEAIPSSDLSERLSDDFEEKNYNAAVINCLRTACERHCPELAAELANGKPLARHSEEDFSRLKGKLSSIQDASGKTRSVTAHAMRFLYVLAREKPGSETRAFEEALLALYILSKIV